MSESIVIAWGSAHDKTNEYQFKTASERDAFLLGVKEACGWGYCDVFRSSEDAHEHFNQFFNDAPPDFDPPFLTIEDLQNGATFADLERSAAE